MPHAGLLIYYFNSFSSCLSSSGLKQIQSLCCLILYHGCKVPLCLSLFLFVLQAQGRSVPAGSAWRSPAALHPAWLFSSWAPGPLCQAWTWSWWAAATACRWWRRDLPQVRLLFLSVVVYPVGNFSSGWAVSCWSFVSCLTGKYMAGCSLWTEQRIVAAAGSENFALFVSPATEAGRINDETLKREDEAPLLRQRGLKDDVHFLLTVSCCFRTKPSLLLLLLL